MELISTVKDLLVNPKHARWICPLLIAADAVLCGLIIWKIPYTEIDWKAYMEQIETYVSGELDYAKIEGGTGPLVYPGVHVYLYRILYALTDHGKNITRAQIIFAGVYLVDLSFVMGCYRMAKAPPYVFPLLIASKRLHSVFMLRCFNDCFATGFLFIAIFAYQKRMWTVGSIVFSLGLGVKMTVLLASPAIGMILLLALGRERLSTQLMLLFQMQVLVGYKFLRANTVSYISRAFNLGRVFLYRWTVNWRFVPEDVFVSKPFAMTLLVTHASLLALFAFTRWTKPANMTLKQTLRFFGLTSENKLPIGIQHETTNAVTPRYILTTVMTSMAVGLLCARTLHYQFYAYVAWVVPALLWQSRMHPVLIYSLWAAQEWAWNVFPSTDTSSGVVVAVLAISVLGSWLGTRGPQVDEGRIKEIDEAINAYGTKPTE